MSAATASPTEAAALLPQVLGAGHAIALGLGQIFLQPRAWTGMLILAGITVHCPLMALQALLGTVIATVAARSLGLPLEAGLQGYNGALVGLAAWSTLSATWPATLVTTVGAAACPAISRLLATVCDRSGLPVLTAPFCVISGLMTMLVGSIAPAPHAGSAAPDESVVVLLAEGVLTSVAEVVLAPSWIAGLVILVGLLVAGRRVATAALLGATVGTIMCDLASGADAAHKGLDGYSPVLTAIAIAAVFLKDGARSWMVALIASALTVIVEWGLALAPIPIYTWPFIITTWAVLAAVRWRDRRRRDGPP
ncbi:urea transporter [Actinomyces gaoshouyii]|uniref:urea transporter n=1 Tax=Actinomyces gaoshouyii TaxID=1960083 RepID=UPI0009BE1BF5|nr:urea transporter [Actinomyces gaoshouyii]ARD42057.1 hypothetical protein B6G06_06645 [Actinomyces gaoshouyii]